MALMQFRTRYACILLLKCHAASWAHKQWGGGRFIQSKAKNDVDAGRDRATPTSVRLDADEEVDSRGAMCTLDYRVATNRHGSHTIKCGTPTPKTSRRSGRGWLDSLQGVSAYALRSQRPPSGTGCGIRLVD